MGVVSRKLTDLNDVHHRRPRRLLSWQKRAGVWMTRHVIRLHELFSPCRRFCFRSGGYLLVPEDNEETRSVGYPSVVDF